MLIFSPKNVNALFIFILFLVFVFDSVPMETKGIFLPRIAVCCLQREALRLEVTSSDRYAKCCLSDNICTDLYTMLASSSTQGQCARHAETACGPLFLPCPESICCLFCQCCELFHLSSLSLLHPGLLGSVLV